MENSPEPQAFKLSKVKKAIIVVGKMGHGKSAFVRMLACPKDQSTIKTDRSNKSVTKDITLYQVDPNLKLHTDDLYIVDTPGLDSDDAAFVIVQRLNEFIFNNSLEIISIVYALDISAGRQLNKDGKGYIFTFFQHLRLRLSIKKRIMTCVLTHFDQHYSKPKTNQKLFLQYQQMFVNEGLKQVWDKRIQWMSEPSTDVSFFQSIIKKQDHKAHKIWTGQWLELRKYIDLSKSQDFPGYVSDLQKFLKLVTEQLGKIFDKDINKIDQLFDSEYILQKKQKNWAAILGLSSVQAAGTIGTAVALETGAATGVATGVAAGVAVTEIGTATGFAATSGFAAFGPGGFAAIAPGGFVSTGFGATGFGLTGFGVTGATTGVAATGAAISLATIGLVTGGVVILGAVGYGIYRYAKDDFSSKQIKWKSQLQKIQWMRLRQFYRIQLALCTRLKDDTISITNYKWIKSVKGQIFDDKKKTSRLLQFKLNKQNYEAEIQSGRLKLTYTIDSLDALTYSQISKTVVKAYYGSL